MPATTTLRPAAPTGPGPGWVQVLLPDGTTLQRPARWLMQADGDGSVRVSEPHGRAAALLRTRAAPEQADLAFWLHHDYPATEPGLHQVLVHCSLACTESAARARFDYGSFAFRSRASAVAVRRGNLATVYVAAARMDQFPFWLPALVHVLASVRGGPAPGPPFVDPELPRWLRYEIPPR